MKPYEIEKLNETIADLKSDIWVLQQTIKALMGALSASIRYEPLFNKTISSLLPDLPPALVDEFSDMQRWANLGRQNEKDA